MTSHQGQWFHVVDAAEEDLLVGLQIEAGDDIMAFDGVEDLRGLGHHHNIGAEAGPAGLTEVAEGKYTVLKIGVAILSKKNIDGGFDISVLIGIIQYHQLGWVFTFQQVFHPLQAFLAYSHRDIGKFACNHGRLVAQPINAVVAFVDDIAARLATIATAEHGRIALVSQQPKQIFHMRSLAGTTCTEVAHANSGHR